MIEEAGGQFIGLAGKPTIHAGEAIATNGRVTDEKCLAIHTNRVRLELTLGFGRLSQVGEFRYTYGILI